MSEQDRPFSAFRGRRKGRRLRAGRASLFDQLLPERRLDVPSLDAAGDWRAQFPADIEGLWLEIGFGSGEHLQWQMA
ncbi:MAG: tRNA (guanosine(46)-N7)-methyltransferase TrmB, partial [Pseudomonadota bacterium]